MKKLLMICAVLMLCSCASIKNTTDRKSVYEKELKEGEITQSEYNYLLKGQKELNKIK